MKSPLISSAGPARGEAPLAGFLTVFAEGGGASEYVVCHDSRKYLLIFAFIFSKMGAFTEGIAHFAS